MKPKCTICNKELEINIFEGATPTIYYFECKPSNHFFSFDLNLINEIYYPRSFYCVNFDNKNSILEIFFNENDEFICKIQDSIVNFKLTIDKIILEDIYNKFINNQLTTQDINSLVSRLKDLALFL